MTKHNGLVRGTKPWVSAGTGGNESEKHVKVKRGRASIGQISRQPREKQQPESCIVDLCLFLPRGLSTSLADRCVGFSSAADGREECKDYCIPRYEVPKPGSGPHIGQPVHTAPQPAAMPFP